MDGENGRLRPDLVVRLPGGKTVIVDAKAPLAAYLDAVDGSLDDVARERLLKDHARQVRDHIVGLGSKAYWNQFQPAPDFVVMFLPGETFFSSACQHDPSLIEFGVAQQVIPGESHHADLAAPSHRLRLAPGANRTEHAGDQRAGPDALRAVGYHGRTLRRSASRPRPCRGELQQRGGVARRQGAGHRRDASRSWALPLTSFQASASSSMPPEDRNQPSWPLPHRLHRYSNSATIYALSRPTGLLPPASPARTPPSCPCPRHAGR